MNIKKSHFIIGLLALAFFFSGYSVYAKPVTTHKTNVIVPAAVIQVPQSQSVRIEVGDKKYAIQVPQKSTVYDAMILLSKIPNSNFSFHSKKYPALGTFVDEINGKKGTRGTYWMYYVNNKKASVGVSAYVLMEKDVITWKQEGF